jgi:YlmC/YmxH family sporulation protein
MAKNYCDLRKKEVVNVNDGRVLGCICDLLICLPEGYIEAIVVPGCSKNFNFFKPGQPVVIPWYQICKIGDDVILVELKKGVKAIEK